MKFLCHSGSSFATLRAAGDLALGSVVRLEAHVLVAPALEMGAALLRLGGDASTMWPAAPPNALKNTPDLSMARRL